MITELHLLSGGKRMISQQEKLNAFLQKILAMNPLVPQVETKGNRCAEKDLHAEMKQKR